MPGHQGPDAVRVFSPLPSSSVAKHVDSFIFTLGLADLSISGSPALGGLLAGRLPRQAHAPGLPRAGQSHIFIEYLGASSISMRFWLDTLAMLFSSPWKHRSLIVQMVRREVIGRYRGSMLGLLWSFLNPVLMLSVYTFVFSVVFNGRWGAGSGDETKMAFAVILFVGMIIHGIFAECVNRAPSLILGNVNLVKKVVFPLEILPWVAMGATLFHASASVGVWALFFFAVNGYLSWTIAFLPLVILPLVFVTMGFAWFLSATGVYLRDVAQTTGILTTMLMFVSPIFYPASALPEDYRKFLDLNPLTFPIEQARAVLVWDRLPDFGGLAGYTLGAFVAALLGLGWFQRTRKGFADVL